MTDKTIKIPESEFEIMRAVWTLEDEGERFISASLIMNSFPELGRLKLTTVLTLIARLESKGFIISKKIGRSNCCSSVVSFDEYKKAALADFVEKIYLNDKIGLISVLLDDILTAEELLEVKAMIEKKEQNDK